MAADVTIIILSFNGEKFLESCISSLLSSNYDPQHYSLIIVDNNSTDKSVALVKRKFPQITIIKNTINYGFAKGCNIALRRCKTPYVALLNQDSIVEKNWLKELSTTLDRNPDAACCGAAEHPYDTTLPMKNILCESTDINNQIWMGGGSVIYRLRALQQVSFFDENYFLYGEDIDLSWRLKLKGWRLILNPKAVWHHYGKNRENTRHNFRVIYSFKSRIYTLLKFGSLSQIIQSLLKYICNSLPRKNYTYSPQHILKGRQNSGLKLSRALLKMKLLITTIFVIPKALHQRIVLDLTSEQHKNVDAWIRYTDEQLLKEKCSTSPEK